MPNNKTVSFAEGHGWKALDFSADFFTSSKFLIIQPNFMQILHTHTQEETRFRTSRQIASNTTLTFLSYTHDTHT
jgi:hypothetical protein